LAKLQNQQLEWRKLFQDKDSHKSLKLLLKLMKNNLKKTKITDQEKNIKIIITLKKTKDFDLKTKDIDFKKYENKDKN